MTEHGNARGDPTTHVYVASSWRNERQPAVVLALRKAGLQVYDFRNPEPGIRGFHWSEIDPAWQAWTPEAYRAALAHPIAAAGFDRDMTALYECDACVLLLPCGRSAHLEAGWAVGWGKRVCVLLADGEPELMYRMADHLALSTEEVVEWARHRVPPAPPPPLFPSTRNPEPAEATP